MQSNRETPPTLKRCLGLRETITISAGTVIGVGLFTMGANVVGILGPTVLLATLAALSLVSARADRNLAEKNAQASVEYYQADARAEEILHELLTGVQYGPGWEEALRADGVAVVRQENAAVVSYQVPINDSKSLSVESSLMFSEEGRFTGEWKRLRWQTLVEEESESQEGTLNLLR